MAKNGSGAVAERKPGRLMPFSQAILDEICDGLAKGVPLTVMCKPDRMPDPSTVWKWREDDPKVFQAIARARQIGFDAISEDVLRIADTPQEGVETTTEDDGSVSEKRGDMLGHRKLQVDARLKLLAKWDPKRYGDAAAQTTVNVGVQVTNISVTEEQMSGIREKLRLTNLRAKEVQAEVRRVEG